MLFTILIVWFVLNVVLIMIIVVVVLKVKSLWLNLEDLLLLARTYVRERTPLSDSFSLAEDALVLVFARDCC